MGSRKIVKLFLRGSYYTLPSFRPTRLSRSDVNDSSVDQWNPRESGVGTGNTMTFSLPLHIVQLRLHVVFPLNVKYMDFDVDNTSTEFTLSVRMCSV